MNSRARSVLWFTVFVTGIAFLVQVSGAAGAGPGLDWASVTTSAGAASAGHGGSGGDDEANDGDEGTDDEADDEPVDCAGTPGHDEDFDDDDEDADGIVDACDNCPDVFNPEQSNLDGSSVFAPARAIPFTGAAVAIFAADVDGDHDLDVIVVSTDGEIVWLENADGAGSFDLVRPIGASADGSLALTAVDLDGDADADVLAAADGTLAWYENLEGTGTFDAARVLDLPVAGAFSFATADLDGDQDGDLLWSSPATGLGWHENGDGLGTFGPFVPISDDAGAQSPVAADVDGDGDADAIAAESDGSTLVWYENADGLGTFAVPRIVSVAGDDVGTILAADMDRDGDIDVVSATADGGEVYCSDNLDGLGTFGPRRSVLRRDTGGAYRVFVGDVDGDGDGDLLMAALGVPGTAWYENLGDPHGDVCDNCPTVPNSDQSDEDLDGVGDVCDLCPAVADEQQTDLDADGFGDACDVCPALPDPDQTDADADGIGDPCDNCPLAADSSQADSDGDGPGDVCDNCPAAPNWSDTRLFAVDGAFAGASLHVLDAETGAVVETIGPTGFQGVVGIDFDPVTGTLFGTVPSARQLIAIDLASGVGALVRGMESQIGDIAFDAAGTLYGWARSGADLALVDPATGVATKVGECAGCKPDTGIACDASGALYSKDITALRILDAGSGAVVATVALQGSDDDGILDFDGLGRLYTAERTASGSTLSRLDPVSGVRTIVGSNGLVGLSGIAFSPAFVQPDRDADGVGDACDPCPADAQNDVDGDGACSDADNCPEVANSSQADADVDGRGDPCDNCPNFSSYDASDSDADGLGDACDPCTDSDGDGFGDPGYPNAACAIDRCPRVFDSDQADVDGDSHGDACDNCPGQPNGGQFDLDGDGAGDACDSCSDEDGDGFGNPGFPASTCSTDVCPGVPDPAQTDVDADDLGDACDNCPESANQSQTNTDGASFPTGLPVATDGDSRAVAADLDGDGDLDLLWSTAPASEISWSANTDGHGAFGPKRAVTIEAPEPRNVSAADLDGDGDLDVLAVFDGPPSDHGVAWYPNLDGGGTFGAQRMISTQHGARAALAADLDGDGDRDVLTASDLDDKIAWHANLDGAGSFGPQRVISGSANSATWVSTADLDGDGDLDVLGTDSEYNRIVWYRNLDGVGSFSTAVLISTDNSEPTSVMGADIDGDGDVDVLASSYKDDEIAWYPNTDGQGSFGAQRVISQAANGALSASAADLNGDGELDVLSASLLDDEIAWYANLGGSFGAQKVISTATNEARSVVAADLDGDGDLDVAGAGDGLRWYPNAGDARGNACDNCPGTGNPDQTDADADGLGDACDNCPSVANPDQANADSDAAGDACDSCTDTDGDGRGDPGFPASTCAGDNCASVANPGQQDGDSDGAGDACDNCPSLANPGQDDPDADGVGDACDNCTAQTNVDQSDGDADGAGDACDVCTDLDGDGAGDPGFPANECPLDTCPAIPNPGQADEDGDGLGSACDNCPFSFNADQVDGDLDGAGDLCDSCTDSDRDGFGDPGYSSNACPDDNCPDVPNQDQGESDGDGLGDACDNCPATPNPDQANADAVAFPAHSVVSTMGDAPARAVVADIDGDLDLDLVVASINDDEVAWYENTDGAGSFGPQRLISSAVDGSVSVFAADLDGDGDLDVLSSGLNDGIVSWFRNQDGHGSFGARQVIASGNSGSRPVIAADLDRDGWTDVIWASELDDRIGWNRSLDGLGSFAAQQIVSTAANGPFAIVAVDLDYDGDLDLLSASRNDDEVAWYPNTNGHGAFGPQQLISHAPDGARSVVAADLDGDGGVDVVSGSDNDDEVAWYQNTTGGGVFGPQKLISHAADGVRAVAVADVDDDGDVDVLSASFNDDEVAWYPNLNGLGTFGPQQVISVAADGATSVAAADLDGDGDLDIISTSANNDTLAWYENTGDRVGDVCDNCPTVANVGQEDGDGDGVGDACEP